MADCISAAFRLEGKVRGPAHAPNYVAGRSAFGFLRSFIDCRQTQDPTVVTWGEKGTNSPNLCPTYVLRIFLAGYLIILLTQKLPVKRWVN